MLVTTGGSPAEDNTSPCHPKGQEDRDHVCHLFLLDEHCNVKPSTPTEDTSQSLSRPSEVD